MLYRELRSIIFLFYLYKYQQASMHQLPILLILLSGDLGCAFGFDKMQFHIKKNTNRRLYK